jgi:hypothetical protein
MMTARTILILILASGCGGKGPTWYEEAAEGAKLTDSTRVRRGAGVAGGVWIAEGTGVAANLILPTDELAAKATFTSEHCKILEGVTSWDSRPGLSPLRLVSSLQDAVATHDGQRYVFTGLVAGPAFGAADELVVSHDKTAFEVRVPAPPPLATANDHVGEPAGLSTVFSAPDGDFAVVTVFVVAYGPTPGEAGISCAYPASAMAASGGWRSIPLVDADTIAEAERRQLTPVTVFAGYFNEVIDEAIFGAPAPIQAGRMVQLDFSDLVP